jgi:elongation factor Tu
MMPIEGVHTIVGRGTVVTGRIERGVLKVNAPVGVVGFVDGEEKRPMRPARSPISTERT